MAIRTWVSESITYRTVGMIDALIGDGADGAKKLQSIEEYAVELFESSQAPRGRRNPLPNLLIVCRIAERTAKDDAPGAPGPPERRATLPAASRCAARRIGWLEASRRRRTSRSAKPLGTPENAAVATRMLDARVASARALAQPRRCLSLLAFSR